MRLLRSLALLLISPLIFSSASIAEIRNKELLSEIFNGCVEQEEASYGWGFQYAYCGCYVHKIANGMTFREVTSLGLDLLEVQYRGEQAVASVALANRKIKSYIAECADSVYQQSIN